MHGKESMAEQATQQLVEQLLNLPYEDRKTIADRLNQSLHPEGENLTFEEWRAAWLPELERRIAAAEDGTEAGRPLEEVWPRIAGKHA